MTAPHRYPCEHLYPPPRPPCLSHAAGRWPFQLRSCGVATTTNRSLTQLPLRGPSVNAFVAETDARDVLSPAAACFRASDPASRLSPAAADAFATNPFDLLANGSEAESVLPASPASPVYSRSLPLDTQHWPGHGWSAVPGPPVSFDAFDETIMDEILSSVQVHTMGRGHGGGGGGGGGGGMVHGAGARQAGICLFVGARVLPWGLATTSPAHHLDQLTHLARTPS